MIAGWAHAPGRGRPPVGGIAAWSPCWRVNLPKARSAAMEEPTITIPSMGCLANTCLKWGADGVLASLDLDSERK